MSMPVTEKDPERLRILLLEDDDDFAVLVGDLLRNNREVAVEVDRAVTLQEATERAVGQHYDAALLDLNVPDSSGLRTVKQFVTELRDVPGHEARTATVVVSATGDAHIASLALAVGALDYVVKEDVSADLLVRIVRYAVQRTRLDAELEAARRGEERERELRRMERLAGERTTSVSASLMDKRSVEEALAGRYDTEVLDEYRRILRASLEEQAYRAGHRVREDVRSLGAVLGYLGAGPRDVIELHSNVLRNLTTEPATPRNIAATEEARFLVLQLMGALADYYRARTVHRSRRSGDGPGREDA